VSLLLAVDTATARASLAVGAPDGAVVERAIEGRRDLSRDIERVAAELLREAGAVPRDLTAVVVADGPGSFTGLRIGIAFAKGVVAVLGVPLLAAPSLMGAAFAAARGAGGVWVAEYDALRGEVYRASYRFGGGAVDAVAAPALASAGDGAPHAREAQASAAALIRLAGLVGGPAPVTDPAGWEPVYGRPAEAEARRLARRDAPGAG